MANTNSSNAPIHSTGRGGAGNIGPDGNTYVDGDIIREGQVGVSNYPEYSAGRGGAGNIIPAQNPPNTPSTGLPSHSSSFSPLGGNSTGASDQIIPESATRAIAPGDGYENFHTGRGGQGNVYKEKYGGHSTKREQVAAEARGSPRNSPRLGPVRGQEGNGNGKEKEGLLEKVKHVVGLDHKREKTPEVGGK